MIQIQHLQKTCSMKWGKKIHNHQIYNLCVSFIILVAYLIMLSPAQPIYYMMIG
jgi:hypothetical protein